MRLLTGKLIKARSFTPLPMPEDVIKQVERMGSSNYSSENKNIPLNPTAANEGYQPPDEEDDLSLASSNYSKISQNELNDIRVENEAATRVDGDSFVLETVISETSIPTEASVKPSDEDQQLQGVQKDNDKNQPQDTVYNFEEDEEDDIPDNLNKIKYDNDLEDNESEEESMSECAEDNESSTIHYVTKRGRDIKQRKDLFDNYEFFQGNKADATTFYESKNMTTQWSLKQGLRHFPKETNKATILELTQLHEMKVFQPVHWSSMTQQEIMGTLNTLTIIKIKRCGRIKARTCADRRLQRSLYQKWESSSPTVRTESVLLTPMIDAYKERTVGVYDIPGAFLHAKQTDLTYVKMTDEAVHFIVEISPSTYKDYVITEKGKGVLYLEIKKALYRCVKSALLFWEDLSGKLFKQGYDINPYDRCVANKIVDNPNDHCMAC
jgi:hypothetical protein